MDKKWVIVFLIYADFRTKESFSMSTEMRVEINEMLKDIVKVPLNTARARMFVILNGIKYHFPVTAKAPTIETKSILYEITRCKDDDMNCLEKCDIISNGPDVLQTAEKLANILKHILVKDDEEVFFITWDHGSAFGIFRDMEPQPPELMLPINDRDELKHFHYLKLFWEWALKKEDIEKFQYKDDPDRPSCVVQLGHELYIASLAKEVAGNLVPFMKNGNANSFFSIDRKKSRLVFNRDGYIKSNASNKNKEVADEKAIPQIEAVAMVGLPNARITEILHNPELASAFKSWLGGKKVGVLLMMNCWMMNLHNMYAMQDCVKCLVAPQGDIACPGYNYRDILKFINNPDNVFNARDLANICVESCENSFAKRRAKRLNKKHPDTIDSWKIIAVDLEILHADRTSLFTKQLQSLEALVAVLVDRVKTSNTPELRYMLKYIRSVCHDFTNQGTLMVDIMNWCLSVKSADKFFLPDHSRVLGDIEAGIVQFRDLVFKSNGQSALLINSTAGKSVYAIADPLLPVAVINLAPSGYSLFFPQYSFSDNPNMIDNVKSDPLLNGTLKGWKEFLTTVIDPEIIF